MDILAEIEGIKYKPFLCKELETYGIEQLEVALSKWGSFLLYLDKGQRLAVSWWVSPKRTRSYPYARVYDTLAFNGRRITIIPVLKDEGKDGDRDFLQWDTISLMSLLNVYVIISYYSSADKNMQFKNKITNQKFDLEHIKGEIKELLNYQSDPLHWNMSQIDKIEGLLSGALASYDEISKRLVVEMHSKESALLRIQEISKGKKNFKKTF
ncbi:MAG: hypothetical protein ACK4VK_03120 [Aquificaceae bacterium]